MLRESEGNGSIRWKAQAGTTCEAEVQVVLRQTLNGVFTFADHQSRKETLGERLERLGGGIGSTQSHNKYHRRKTRQVLRANSNLR